MAFTGNHIPLSLKQQLLEGVHDFRAAGDTFKLALYDSTATLNALTTAYTATGEVTASGTYAAGGGNLTAINPSLLGSTAFIDFDDISFTGATITARGALIYNSTPAHTYTDPAVLVLDFGIEKSVVAGTFTVHFPSATVTDAIIRIT
jgi:hypothetical protein